MELFIKGSEKPLFHKYVKLLQSQFSVTWSAYISVLSSDLAVGPTIKVAGSYALLKVVSLKVMSQCIS